MPKIDKSKIHEIEYLFNNILNPTSKKVITAEMKKKQIIKEIVPLLEKYGIKF